MRILIIGGGIGGLTAAIALKRAGLEVVVFERAPELREVGAGITLWSNAVRVLQELGLGERLSSVATPLKQSEICRSDGRVLIGTDISPLSDRAGAPTLGIHRAELQQLLYEAAGDCARLGMACTAVRQDDRTVMARFAHGWEEQGDVLIGADGLRSVIRTELFGNSRPRYAGYTAWRGIARLDEPITDSCQVRLAIGRGSQFGYLPIGERLIYWFATANVPAGMKDPPGATVARLLQRFRGWAEPIPTLLAATEESAVIRNDVYDRPPSRPWGRGRITLLGDAAHPTTPNLGQGAGMAIEDGLVLARCLEKATDVAAALRSYEQQRYDRTAYVTRQSWRLGRMLGLEGRLWCWLRNTVICRSSRRIQGDTERFITAEI